MLVLSSICINKILLYFSGTVKLPKKTKSGRLVITPAAYKDQDDSVEGRDSPEIGDDVDDDDNYDDFDDDEEYVKNVLFYYSILIRLSCQVFFVSIFVYIKTNSFCPALIGGLRA